MRTAVRNNKTKAGMCSGTIRFTMQHRYIRHLFRTYSNRIIRKAQSFRMFPNSKIRDSSLWSGPAMWMPDFLQSCTDTRMTYATSASVFPWPAPQHVTRRSSSLLFGWTSVKYTPLFNLASGRACPSTSANEAKIVRLTSAFSFVLRGDCARSSALKLQKTHNGKIMNIFSWIMHLMLAVRWLFNGVQTSVFLGNNVFINPLLQVHSNCYTTRDDSALASKYVWFQSARELSESFLWISASLDSSKRKQK